MVTMLVCLTAGVRVDAAPAATVPPATPAAPDAPVYAFLSLIGDKLDLVVAQPQTSTRVDKSRPEPPVAIQDAIFDTTAANAAGDAVRAVVHNAELTVLNSRSAILFDKQTELFEEKDGLLSIPGPIQKALQKEKATHFVLVSKYRDEAQFLFRNASDATAPLEGLGFYIDGAGNSATDSAGRGFVAPFMYARVSLVDARTSKVIARKTITASMNLLPAKAGEDLANPWTALTSSEKINGINKLIKRELARVVPQLLKMN